MWRSLTHLEDVVADSDIPPFITFLLFTIIPHKSNDNGSIFVFIVAVWILDGELVLVG